MSSQIFARQALIASSVIAVSALLVKYFAPSFLSSSEAEVSQDETLCQNAASNATVAEKSTPVTDVPLSNTSTSNSQAINTTACSSACCDLDDASDMPSNYMQVESTLEKCKERWLLTKKWRAENNVGQILRVNLPKFEQVRNLCGHFYHKTDKHGHLVYFERLKKFNTTAIKALGISVDQVMTQYIHQSEYCWTNLDNSPDALNVAVFDLVDMSFTDFMGETTTFTRKMASIMSSHFPARTCKIVLINTPPWFTTFWSLLKSILADTTQTKTIMCGTDKKEIRKVLLELIDEENIPKIYGGTCDCQGDCTSNSPQEKQYRQFMRAIASNQSED
jgi:hypothetical protein